MDGIQSETQKRAAIKAQLRFRKIILQQEAVTDPVYKFSSKEKGQFNSKVLRDNLIQLIRDADDKDIADTSSNTLLLTGSNIGLKIAMEKRSFTKEE